MTKHRQEGSQSQGPNRLTLHLTSHGHLPPFPLPAPPLLLEGWVTPASISQQKPKEAQGCCPRNPDYKVIGQAVCFSYNPKIPLGNPMETLGTLTAEDKAPMLHYLGSKSNYGSTAPNPA